MNTEKSNQKTLSDRDSVFTSHPKEYYYETTRQANILQQNISIVTMLVYCLTLLSMIWFIWLPAYNRYRSAEFYHSPTFFFILIWIIVIAITIYLSIYNIQLTARRKEKAITETKEIADEVYLLEEELEK